MQKKREDRVKVLAKARMREGSAWSEVCLVNLSSRGVGLQCATPPKRGAFVEVRRGNNVIIIGQVAWSQGHRFGIRTQDVIWVPAVLNDLTVEPAAPCTAERRAVPRTAAAHDRSRLLARRLQGGFVVGGALCFALILGDVVQDTVSRPMTAIAVAMTGQAAEPAN